MTQRYKTRQREVILSFFRENSNRCFSAKEVLSLLEKQGAVPGETTVYRTLSLLCREGALTRYNSTGTGGATYQYTTENPACEHHLHLKCRSCDKLYHLECSRLQILSEHLKDEHGFSVNQADTILYGTCAACEEAKK